MGEGCDDAVHQLYHFLDGELDDQKRLDIKRTSACPVLRPSTSRPSCAW
jgi:hypothetical protein